MSEIPLITVIDDDAAVREAVQSLLRSVGLGAAGFASAPDFLQSGQLPDTAYLIVDVRMPGMSGLELQQQLTTAQCPLPILFITAHGDAATRARALSAGAVGWLDTLFSAAVLLRAVQAALPSVRGDGEGSPRGAS
jgi:FixJ family two-component response regulator